MKKRRPIICWCMLPLVAMCFPSCFIPFADREKLNIAPRAMHVVSRDSNADVTDVLILTINENSRGGKNIVDATVFSPKETFPMYRSCTWFLSGPCPQEVSKRATDGFMVFAPGYAPALFVPYRSGDKVEWQLRAITAQQSRRVFEKLRGYMKDGTVAYGTLMRWGDLSSSIDYGTTQSEKEIMIDFRLSMQERHLVNEFIDALLAKL